MERLQKNKLEHLTAQSAAMARIDSLRQEIRELEGLMLEIKTNEGKESVDAEIDKHTNGALTEISKELDDISIRIETDDPARVQEDNERLDAMEKRLSSLTEHAKRVFIQKVFREEEMQRVAERLENCGWDLKELQRGKSLQDECCLFIQGSRGEKATIRFCLDGTVEVVSSFLEDSNKTRASLQHLVLQTIRENSKNAKGYMSG